MFTVLFAALASLEGYPLTVTSNPVIVPWHRQAVPTSHLVAGPLKTRS